MYQLEIFIYKIIASVYKLFEKEKPKDEHEVHWGIGGR
jgi:hypothetical protein